MAQEKYGFFDSSGGDIRSYNAAEMALAFHTLASNGVANLGSCLQVTAEGSTMRTLVGYGTAMIEGYYYRLRDDGSGVQAFTHTTEAGMNRIDRIVLRLDLTTRSITLVKKTGTAAATPQAPAILRNAEIYEISLAQVRIRAGASVLLSTDITDERADDAVCGLIAPESLRRSEIEQMLEDATDGVVRCTPQSLTESEQAQARENINAADAGQLHLSTFAYLGDIGLATSPVPSLSEVCNAMPDNAILALACLNSYTGDITPSASRLGTLYIIKRNQDRMIVEFHPKTDNTLWTNYAYYYNDVWTVGEWRQITPVTEVSAVLAAASWSGNGPYTQAVPIAGMTADAKAVFGLPHTVTGVQYWEAAEALLRVTSQGDNTVTITAEGYKPTVDIPILIQIVG